MSCDVTQLLCVVRHACLLRHYGSLQHWNFTQEDQTCKMPQHLARVILQPCTLVLLQEYKNLKWF